VRQPARFYPRGLAHSRRAVCQTPLAANPGSLQPYGFSKLEVVDLAVLEFFNEAQMKLPNVLVAHYHPEDSKLPAFRQISAKGVFPDNRSVASFTPDPFHSEGAVIYPWNYSTMTKTNVTHIPYKGTGQSL
jgi:hypothetical protein